VGDVVTGANKGCNGGEEEQMVVTDRGAGAVQVVEDFLNGAKAIGEDVQVRVGVVVCEGLVDANKFRAVNGIVLL
jgi:hypothetical protein